MQKILKKTCKKWSPVFGGWTFILSFVLICATHAATVTTTLQTTQAKRYYRSCRDIKDFFSYCIPADVQLNDYCRVTEANLDATKICLCYRISRSDITTCVYDTPYAVIDVDDSDCGLPGDYSPQCLPDYTCTYIEVIVDEGMIGDIFNCLPKMQVEVLVNFTSQVATTEPATAATKPTTTMSPLPTRQIVQKEIISVKRQEKLQHLLNAICSTIQQQKKQLVNTPQQKLEYLVSSLCELTQQNVKHSNTHQQNLGDGYSNPNFNSNEDLYSGSEIFSKKIQIVWVVTAAISVSSLLFPLL